MRPETALAHLSAPALQPRLTHAIDTRSCFRLRPQHDRHAVLAQQIASFSGAYSPYAQIVAAGLIARTRSITGSASRVAVCIGR